jgi:hypothetical protein
MALIELYSTICIQGMCLFPVATSFDRNLVVKFAGHHEAIEAFLLSVAGVMVVLVMASLVLLLMH